MKNLINAKSIAMFVFFVMFVVVWGVKFAMGVQLDPNLAFNLSVTGLVRLLGMVIFGLIWVFSRE